MLRGFLYVCLNSYERSYVCRVAALITTLPKNGRRLALGCLMSSHNEWKHGVKMHDQIYWNQVFNEILPPSSKLGTQWRTGWKSNQIIEHKWQCMFGLWISNLMSSSESKIVFSFTCPQIFHLLLLKLKHYLGTVVEQKCEHAYCLAHISKHCVSVKWRKEKHASKVFRRSDLLMYTHLDRFWEEFIYTSYLYLNCSTRQISPRKVGILAWHYTVVISCSKCWERHQNWYNTSNGRFHGGSARSTMFFCI